MGRKPKNPGEKKTNILRIAMTEKDRAIIDSAAKGDDMETSTWVRRKILELIRAKKKSTSA